MFCSAFSLLIYSILLGSETKVHTTTVSTSVTNQAVDTQPTEQTVEPVGDRWDDEDWGSLEVMVLADFLIYVADIVGCFKLSVTLILLLMYAVI